MEQGAEYALSPEAEQRIYGPRFHSSDDMDGLRELADYVGYSTAVVIRPDGTLDVYGHIALVDQRAQIDSSGSE